MYFLALKDKDGEYKRHEVSEEVYIYVRQLESYINYPLQSKLKEVYSERFKDDITDHPIL